MSRKRRVSKAKFSGARFYEFFAGGGMARAGLGPEWKCLFSNDIDKKKVAAYSQTWRENHLKPRDVGDLTIADLPGKADLAWASFPCQDLSLAGVGAGLEGARSRTFWPFWELMKALNEVRRAPALVVLENVCGALTSHDGQDFRTLIGALADLKYRYGVLVIDAAHFVPQSRPRLFIVAVKNRVKLPPPLIDKSFDPSWTSAALLRAYNSLGERHKRSWLWWRLPKPPARKTVFSDLIEEEPESVRWHTEEETERLIGLMSQVTREKLESAKRGGHRMVGAVYKRMRVDAEGTRTQRAEARFDDLAGCLRTPVGGSSRQLIMIVDGERIRSRLLSSREAARLMGLPEEFELPKRYNDAYHLVSDGLVVPVVRHLATHILEPIMVTLRANK
jgi:DNA (cytosine-5)-methyltransferase 1